MFSLNIACNAKMANLQILKIHSYCIAIFKTVFLFLMLFLSISQTSASYPESIAVIYPETKGPYRTTFQEIIDGIEEHYKGNLLKYPFSSGTNLKELGAEINKRHVAVTILISRQGLEVLPELDRSMPIVIGGIFSLPKSEVREIAGISLIPDPKLFFLKLKNLLPKTKKVAIIYNPAHNDWIIKGAREAATAYGLTLTALQASDLSTAARLYNTFLQEASSQDALWILPDATTLDEESIFSLILRASWERNLPVFSSKLAHVQKGVLFALYPDNKRMGNALAKLAIDAASGVLLKMSFKPLQEVDSAISMRTATHLGIEVDSKDHFDIVFPER